MLYQYNINVVKRMRTEGMFIMNDILKEIILGDEYLTSNIEMPAPDPFGLDAPTWEELYDSRVNQIVLAVTKAIYFSDRVYTGAEVAELMNAYHTLIKKLEADKDHWLSNTRPMQGNQGFNFKEVITCQLREPGVSN